MTLVTPKFTTKSIVLIVAMICITCYGGALTLSGQNGKLSLTVIGALVTIAGYLFRQKEVVVV